MVNSRSVSPILVEDLDINQDPDTDLDLDKDQNLDLNTDKDPYLVLDPDTDLGPDMDLE